MKLKTKLLAAIVTATLIAPTAFAETDKAKIDDILEILEQNPSVVDSLHESLAAYAEFRNQYDETLKKEHDYMYNNDAHSSFGAENPEMTIVNFTDYSCPFCKKLDPVLIELVEKYPQIKVINIYVPIKEMSNSYNSGGFALNVWDKEEREIYEEVHEILVAKPGEHDERSLERIAKKFGLEKHLKEDPMKSAILAKNYQLFTQLGIRGTPGMLIGDEIIPGYMPIERLEPIILDLMEKQKAESGEK